MLKYILFLTLWVTVINLTQAGEKPAPGKTIRILTVGNSFSNNACTYLDSITSSVKGCRITIAKASLGGCSLERHARLIDSCEINPNRKPYPGNFCLNDLLKPGGYDFITIQQVSTSSFKFETYQPYAGKLIDFIRQQAPGAQIIVHQTWAYAANSQRLKDWGMSREEMHKGLAESYDKLATAYGLGILPSGSAFLEATRLHPEIDLWNADRYHANMNGCYLAGCVWFGKIFGISPKKVNFKPEGMSPETAVFLRNIAAKTIKKHKIKNK